MSQTDYKIAKAIVSNNEDEHEAIEGYLELLELLTDPADIAQIQEIIGDEKEHSHCLTEMQLKYDGGIPEAKD